MKLRWEKSCGGSWVAYSGKMLIGLVVERDDGSVGYKIDNISMKYIGKGSGHVSSISAGKRAIERGWRQWLTAAGLV